MATEDPAAGVSLVRCIRLGHGPVAVRMSPRDAATVVDTLDGVPLRELRSMVVVEELPSSRSIDTFVSRPLVVSKYRRERKRKTPSVPLNDAEGQVGVHGMGTELRWIKQKELRGNKPGVANERGMIMRDCQSEKRRAYMYTIKQQRRGAMATVTDGCSSLCYVGLSVSHFIRPGARALGHQPRSSISESFS